MPSILSQAFIAVDQVFLKDPLPYLHPTVEVQGLSDWTGLTVPTAKVRLDELKSSQELLGCLAHRCLAVKLNPPMASKAIWQQF